MQSIVDGVEVVTSWHALHENVADVAQYLRRGQEHESCKNEGADGISNVPAWDILQGKDSSRGLKCIQALPHEQHGGSSIVLYSHWLHRRLELRQC